MANVDTGGPPHIRTRVSRARTRPGYLRPPAPAVTLCGQPPTTWDLSYADACQTSDWPACPDCRRIQRADTPAPPPQAARPAVTL